ncbi:BMP family ABC transporter substrate-binding protein [Rhodococcus rhodochrous]|uniref:BMP family ABC transporter substrate-binding protein n=2 Tax=Rhodococcus rhodochrous TaxID=1829 RepID=UPI0011A72B76|nr:BMP family ABC transporter substrate-binding protein [Rhodococcus rhodochrous]
MSRTRMSKVGLSLTVAAVAGVTVLTGCSATAGGDDEITVGVIMVGSENDAGYNQAVSDAATALDAQEGVNVIKADQVAENNSVTDTMQSMVDQGAEVIFATSYGYHQYAVDFAKSHPDVVVMHQSGFYEGDSIPDNFGTYWSAGYELVSLGGIAAGEATESDKIGFIYAFPVAQTIANINAFHLGAASVNPNVTTSLVNTSDWCDPVKQKQAVASLTSQGVDVFSQHQDCQSTVIQAAKDADAKVVGYHYDAADIAGDAWLTGSSWNWAPVMIDIVELAQKDEFTGSEYNDNWLGMLSDGNSSLTLADFGPSVDDATKSMIEEHKASIEAGEESIFTGPIKCQDGSLLVAEGETATYADINGFDCLVEGVVGTLPKS